MLGHLGWGELAVLLLVGLFVVGPERLPGVAADAGRTLRRIREYLKGMSEDLKAELGPEVGDLDLAALHPRTFVQRHLFSDDEPLAAPARTLRAGEPAPWDPDTT